MQTVYTALEFLSLEFSKKLNQEEEKLNLTASVLGALNKLILELLRFLSSTNELLNEVLRELLDAFTELSHVLEVHFGNLLYLSLA